MRRQNGQLFRARALVDPGSEVNLATINIAQRAGCIQRTTHLPLASVGGYIFDTARSSTSIWLLPHDKSARPLAITALLLPRLTLTVPRRNLVGKQWHHLHGIRLADPSFRTPGDIDLVLGSEAYARIIRDGVRSGPSGTPTAQNSTLGWLVFGGEYPSCDNAMIATSSVPQDPIAEVLQRFWSLEEVGDCRKLSADEKDCERQFNEGCRRDSSGRYIVRLPMRKPERSPASGSLGVAKRALARVQAKMELDPEYAREYRKFMNDYEALGHMRAIPDSALPPDSSRVFYLPHHAIQQVSDQTRKFRVVFNASCKVGSGPSVNECLHTGPPLQSDLVTVICKWRLYRIAAGADIEKMYRQILVDPADIDLQRILWLRPDGRETHYQLLTVTYGVSCAPYLALRVIRQLAHDESERFPRAAQIILSSSYVDDILYGADDISTARQLRDELIGLTRAGGFRLHKWSSSHPQVLDDLHPDLRLRPEGMEGLLPGTTGQNSRGRVGSIKG